MASRASVPSSAAFPRLHPDDHEITSPSTPRYNCIAWAAGDEANWWWPDIDEVAYWPDQVPRAESIEAFIDAFRTLGYLPCEDGEFEPGFEKVALYALDGLPTHAARQLADGRWSSKLGRSVDIAHTPDALDGPIYGAISLYLRRQASGFETAFPLPTPAEIRSSS
jgi:hypothetical protein